MLERPVVRHEIEGQPIEQLRMRGQCALRTEVFACQYDPATEKLFPMSIHSHSSGQRVLSINEPTSKPESIAGQIVGKRRESFGRIGSHNIARVEKTSPSKNVRRTLRFRGQLLHDRRLGYGRSLGFRITRMLRFKPGSKHGLGI